MNAVTDIKRIVSLEELEEAYKGSYYFVPGAGGDLQEWVDGYTAEMDSREIGRPSAWYMTEGIWINAFAQDRHGPIDPRNQFQPALTCLLFPLDGLVVGRLAMLKMHMSDRWFDDVIDNMRSGA